MSGKPKIRKYKNLRNVVTRLRDDLRSSDNGGVDFVLLYAFNGTGKTRLSMEFKEVGKRKKNIERDTLYFNAFTEDLFSWDNDLNNDSERALRINSDSRFFAAFKTLPVEDRIFTYLARYAAFNFKIDYNNWNIVFSKEVENPRFRPGSDEPETITVDHIKISRGEENIFIWCVYLAVCELALDESDAYDWVRYFYIDDPISSLDDNNAIAVASDLAKLLRRSSEKNIKTVISSHHSLFFNVMCNELKKKPHKLYYLHENGSGGYSLQSTTDTPFFHHVAMLSELQKACESGRLYANHFNVLRGVLEKTSSFFGFSDFSGCIHGIEDEVLFSRALNLLSHGDYSLFEPRELTEDNKQLFQNIFEGFLERYEFDLPKLQP